jgi:RES domain-containing protein
MHKHVDSERMSQALTRCQRLAVSWRGSAFRSASPRYANRDDFLTGAGAKIAGARWNPPNSFATLYTSLAPDTAVVEGLAHHRYFQLPIEEALPRILASVRIVLQRVLDLTNSVTRKHLGLTRDALLNEDWRGANSRGDEALTQAIGRLAWEAEWEGLLVPSAADHDGVNLVIFPSNLTPPDSYVLAINRGQLPPLSGS